MSDEWGTGAHVIDVRTGELRVCDGMCTTCVFRPGNLMNLQPGRVKEMVDAAVADEGHITCHQTLGTPEPAICAGYAEHPVGRVRSMALRFLRAGILRLKSITPRKN